MGDEMVVGATVPLSEVAKSAAKLWRLLLVAGLLSLGFGIWLIVDHSTAPETVAWIVGRTDILCAIGVLLVLVGFSVDMGSWYRRGARLQTAVDAAALAGVVHLPGDPAGARAAAKFGPAPVCSTPIWSSRAIEAKMFAVP